MSPEELEIAKHNFEARCRIDRNLKSTYSACLYAERRIAELEEALWTAYQDSGSTNDYDIWVAALLGDGEK